MMMVVMMTTSIHGHDDVHDDILRCFRGDDGDNIHDVHHDDDNVRRCP